MVATGGVLCFGAVVDPRKGGKQSAAPSVHASMRLRRARILNGVVASSVCVMEVLVPFMVTPF